MFVGEGFEKLDPDLSITSSFYGFKATYDLQFVLPKLLLLRLVQEREIAHMVHEYISQNREFGMFRSNFTPLGSEWGSKVLEG